MLTEQVSSPGRHGFLGAPLTVSLSQFQGAVGFASAPPEEVIFPPGK